MPEPSTTLGLIEEVSKGDTRAAESLIQLVYDDLRAQASRYVRERSPGETLRPTALVHEAYLRLVGSPNANWTGKSHFFHAAAQAMRWVIKDHLRAKCSQKRGGDLRRVNLDIFDLGDLIPGFERLEPDEAHALDRALGQLEAESPQSFEIIELRYLSGLTIEETASHLGVASRTVERHSSFGRAYLRACLSDASPRLPFAS